MHPTYRGVNVICPFYADKEDKHNISCEGPIRRTLTKVCFKSKEEKELYKFKYCEHNYDHCRIAKMLTAKYE